MSAVVEGLRAAADLIEQHPELPAPYITSEPYGAEAKWFLQLKVDGQKEWAAEILRTLGGKWDKGAAEHSGGLATFSQSRGPLRLYVSAQREAICERVVVGTETRTIPAVEAQSAEPERTETVEKVEWRCESVLAEATS